MPLAKPAHAIAQEAAELRQYKTLAESITHNAKGEALLLALNKGFEKAAHLGAPGKALIFTESRRTQSYLKELLQANGYAGSIVTLNGTNNDPDALHIYRHWFQRHAGQDVLTGSKSVDIRAALVEEFRERAAIRSWKNRSRHNSATHAPSCWKISTQMCTPVCGCIKIKRHNRSRVLRNGYGV